MGILLLKLWKRLHLLFCEFYLLIYYFISELFTTAFRWGNFIIDKIVKNESGDKVISMEVSKEREREKISQ